MLHLWRMLQTVLCWAPALIACRHVPREMPWPCCQPGLTTDGCCSGLLAGGINPCGKIVIGNSGDCHGLLIPSALRSPGSFSSPAKIFAVGSTWSCCWAGVGQLSLAVTCAVPTWSLQGQCPELALEGTGCADIWELILGPSLPVLQAPLSGRCSGK